MIYLLVLFIMFYCLHYISNSTCSEAKINKVSIFVIVILVLLAGCKYRVGTDALLYQDLYEVYPTIKQLTKDYVFDSRWGALFVTWYSLCHTYLESFVYYQFIHAIIVLCAIYLTLRNNTKYILPALIVFFVYIYTFIVFDLYREGLAVAMFLIGFHFLQKEKIYIYYGFCLIAFFIHTSSFLIFLIPLLNRFVLSKKVAIISFVCILASSVVAFRYSILLLEYLPVGDVTALGMTYLSRYNDTAGMSLSRLVYCCIMFYFVFYRNVDKERDERENLLFNIAFVSLAIMCYEKAIPFVFRLNSYFIIFFMIYLCKEIEVKIATGRSYMVYFVAVTLMFSSVRMMDLFMNDVSYNAYFPYVSIFDPYTVPDREWHDAIHYMNYDR